MAYRKTVQKRNWVMVMMRGDDDEWGNCMSYDIDHHGAIEAMRLANEYIANSKKNFPQLEFMLKGGEW